MNELLSGMFFCDLTTEGADADTPYKLQFNAGRLVGGLLLMALGGTAGWFLI